MVTIIFLTFEQILAIHDNQIELYGGRHGIRDLALFESAVMRPQTTFGGKDLYPTIFNKAAVLMHSLVMNHPFIDGNKRTGVVSALMFLESNGIEIITGQKEIVKVALELESKSIDINNLASWFKNNSRKV